MLTSLCFFFFFPFSLPAYLPSPTQELRSTQVSLSTCPFLSLTMFPHHTPAFQLLPVSRHASSRPIAFVYCYRSAIFLHFSHSLSHLDSICLPVAFTTVHFFQIPSAVIAADWFIFSNLSRF